VPPELFDLLARTPGAVNTALVFYFVYATLRHVCPELLLVVMATCGTEKRRKAALDALRILRGQDPDPATDPPEGLGQGP
jgi:hypothetical protein